MRPRVQQNSAAALISLVIMRRAGQLEFGLLQLHAFIRFVPEESATRVVLVLVDVSELIVAVVVPEPGTALLGAVLAV